MIGFCATARSGTVHVTGRVPVLAPVEVIGTVRDNRA